MRSCYCTVNHSQVNFWNIINLALVLINVRAKHARLLK
jgi:hypothetical protein